MSDQQINIAIAEACPTIVGLGADGIYYLRTGLVEFDPCNDLNAMHEAERARVRKGRLADYSAHLYHVSVPKIAQHDDHFIDHVIAGYIAHATARQRAEAFLRTIGKWEEAQ